MPLAFRNIDVLPAEEPGINGPGPGPTIARVAPRVANMMGIQGSPAREKAIHNSARATTAPVTGVHKPTRRSIARTGCNDWRGHGCKLMCFTKVDDPIMN